MAIAGNQVQTLSPWEQQLASFPDVTIRKPPGDGTEPKGVAGTQPTPQDATQQPAQPSRKTLQDADVPTKSKAIEALARSQDRLVKNRWAIDVHYNLVRSGVPFSRLWKVPNQNLWMQQLPNGMSRQSAAAVPNKADDLCNKLEDTLMADPAKPLPQPHVNDEAAERAADLLAEVLAQEAGEAGINELENYRWALKNAFPGSSSFLYYRVAKQGGGYQPLQVLAHPKAAQYNPTDQDANLIAEVPLESGTPGQPPIMVQERTNDPVMRYVSANNQFVDEASQADKVWRPKVVVERLKREQVRTFPPTKPVETANAVLLIRYLTVQEAMAEWPDTVGQMPDEQLQQLTSWRPTLSDMILPFSFKSGMTDAGSGASVAEVGSFAPLLQRFLFVYSFYVKACPEYEAGYHVDLSLANGGILFEETDLEYEVQLPTQGTDRRCRDIPVTQIRPLQDTAGMDPFGWPIIARFAGSSEAEMTLYGAFMDYCDNMLHPHVFLRGTASVDDTDWFDRLNPILLGPQDQKPEYEQFTQLPPILPLIENLDQKQDTISGLTATAQGLDSSNSISGVAKNLTIRQAQVALSGIQQNLQAAQTRGWRIQAQLYQAYYETPQMIQFSGESGSSEVIWWTGENLAGVDRIGIQPGTGTMMTPEAKANYVAFLQQQQWLPPDRAAEVALPGIRMDLGLPEDPFEEAIERMVGTFLQGPPEGWMEAAQQQEQQLQAEQAAYQARAADSQANGLQTLPFQPPQQPPLPTPFPPRPNDTLPAVATVYIKALSKLFVRPAFNAFPPEWQQLAATAFQRYQQALQPPPAVPDVRIIGSAKDAATLQAEEQVANGAGKQPTPASAPRPPAVRVPQPPPSPKMTG